MVVLNRAQPIFSMRAQLGQSCPQKLWTKGEFSCRKHCAIFVKARQQNTPCRSCDVLLPPCTLEEAGYMSPAGALTPRPGTLICSQFLLSCVGCTFWISHRKQMMINSMNQWHLAVLLKCPFDDFFRIVRALTFFQVLPFTLKRQLARVHNWTDYFLPSIIFL